MKGIRVVLAALSLTGLPACTPLSQGSLDTLKQAFQSTSLKVDESRLSPTSAYLLLRAPDTELVMGRGFSDQGLETWYGAGEELLTLQQGLLVDSLGMTRNLAGVRWLAANPFAAPLDWQTLPLTYSRQIDRLPEHFNEVTEYRLEDRGAHRIKAWKREIDTRRLQEVVVRSNAAQPLPGNTYWLAANGELVQSRQWLAPDYEVIIQPRPQNPAPVPAAVTEPSAVESGSDRHMVVAMAPERLNVLLRNHPLPQAWLPGAAWLVRQQEMPQHQLKRGVLYDIDKALAETDKGKSTLSPAASERLKVFRARLAEMPVTGRKSLPPLNARWLQANPQRDPLFNGGDRLVRPLQRPAHVQVLGDVPQDCFLPVTPDLTVRQAVTQCINARFLPDTVFRIDPDGRVTRVEVALWNRGEERGVMTGSRIFVPFAGQANVSGNAQADVDLARWLATQIDPMAAPVAVAPDAAAAVGVAP